MLEGLFLIEGRKNVFELAQSGIKVEYLLLTKKFESKYPLPNFDPGVRVEYTTPEVLSQLGAFKTNEDIVAVAHMLPEREQHTAKGLFVLDGVSDPGNLGTIIRTLDWFGFDQVLCSHDTADFYNPKTISASMGSYTRVNVRYGDLPKVLKDSGRQLYLADLNGTSLSAFAPKEPYAVVMGSESHGVRPEVRALYHEKVTIPQIGLAESLNVGVATGIIAHHLRS